MQTIFKVTIFSMCLALAIGATPLARSPRVDLNVIQLMMRTTAASQSNPTRSMECFGYYMPILNEITANYELAFRKCLASADAARDILDKSTIDEKNALIRSGQESCDLLTSCSVKQNSLDLFDCYARTGSDTYQTIYSMSADASKTYDIVYEDYHQIDVQENRCTSAAERDYMEDTAKTSDDMNACLSGDSPIPSQ